MYMTAAGAIDVEFHHQHNFLSMLNHALWDYLLHYLDIELFYIQY